MRLLNVNFHLAASHRRFGPLELVSFILYCAVIIFAIPHHVTWADESQAWLIARDMRWWQMMSHGLGYEASPGLWHNILKILIAVHIPFSGVRWICGIWAAAGVFILLRYSPFPPFIRLLLPFGFFLSYQLAVVERSYVLFPLLAFGSAALIRSAIYETQKPRPLLLSVLLGLLANVALHGLLTSVGLAVVAFLSFHREGNQKIVRSSYRSAAILLLLFWGIAIYTAMPPKDISFLRHQARPSSKVSSQPVTLDEQRLKPVSVPHEHRTAIARWVDNLTKATSVISYPFSSFSVIAVLMVVCYCGRFLKSNDGASMDNSDRSKRNWRINMQTFIQSLPYLLVLGFMLAVYVQPWHTAVLFVAFLLSAWLTWPEKLEKSRPLRITETGFVLLFFLCIVQHLSWTVHAISSETKQPYSGDYGAAHFLNQNAQGKSVAGFTFYSVGVLPYFYQRTFTNQPQHGYWIWSNSSDSDALAPESVAAHPDFIVVGASHAGDQEIRSRWKVQQRISSVTDPYAVLPYFLIHGYHETHRFCGHMWMRGGYAEELCQVILEPIQ